MVDKGTRGHSLKLAQFGTCRTVESILFNKDIHIWNQLDQLAVDAFSNALLPSEVVWIG